MNEQENVWITDRIGAALRKAREDRGMTQSELAGLVAASQPQIANYELGGHDMPLSRFFDIASILGVAPGDLLAD